MSPSPTRLSHHATLPRSGFNHGLLGKTHLWAACFSDRKLVGYVDVVSDGVADAYIRDLVVHPDHQHRGIGSHLLDLVIGAVRDDGVRMANVVFEPGLERLYRKSGFHIMAGGVIDFDPPQPSRGGGTRIADYPHRRVDLDTDRSALLDFHCEVIFDCESHLARQLPFSDYRNRWLATDQPQSFLSSLSESMADQRTVAQIWQDGAASVAYVWMTYIDVPEYDFTIAELNEIAVAPAYRNGGLGTRILGFVEKAGRDNGANVIRSGTGIENTASQSMHRKAGFCTYRVEFEKVLSFPGDQ